MTLMIKRDKNTEKKINKELSNVLIVYSFVIAISYITITAGTRIVKELQPSSIQDIYQIVGYLSILLLLPSSVISISIFARIMNKKSSWLHVMAVSALPAILIWVISTLVLALLNIDALTSYGIDLI